MVHLKEPCSSNRSRNMNDASTINDASAGHQTSHKTSVLSEIDGNIQHAPSRQGQKGSLLRHKQAPVQANRRVHGHNARGKPSLTLDTNIDGSSPEKDNHPAVSVDEVIFMGSGDEMGELALGHFDGDCSYDAMSWSAAEEDLDRRDRQRKLNIRRSISKSITPRMSLFSPRAVDGELETAIDWNKHQQEIRRQSFPHSTPKSEGYTQVQQEDAENYNEGVSAGKSSQGSWSWTPGSAISPLTMCDEYPDTSPGSYSGRFDFQEKADSVDTPISKKNKEKVPTENEYEVQTSLPQPNSSWYRNFFGAVTAKSKARPLDTFSNSPKRATTAGKRLSRHVTNQQERHPPAATLQNILTEAELLVLAGYKDYGNGLAEC